MKVRQICILDNANDISNAYEIGYLEGVLKANGIDRIEASYKIYKFICTDKEYEKIMNDLKEIEHVKEMQ